MSMLKQNKTGDLASRTIYLGSGKSTEKKSNAENKSPNTSYASTQPSHHVTGHCNGPTDSIDAKSEPQSQNLSSTKTNEVYESYLQKMLNANIQKMSKMRQEYEADKNSLEASIKQLKRENTELTDKIHKIYIDKTLPVDKLDPQLLKQVRESLYIQLYKTQSKYKSQIVIKNQQPVFVQPTSRITEKQSSARNQSPTDSEEIKKLCKQLEEFRLLQENQKTKQQRYDSLEKQTKQLRRQKSLLSYEFKNSQLKIESLSLQVEELKRLRKAENRPLSMSCLDVRMNSEVSGKEMQPNSHSQINPTTQSQQYYSFSIQRISSKLSANNQRLSYDLDAQMKENISKGKNETKVTLNGNTHLSPPMTTAPRKRRNSCNVGMDQQSGYGDKKMIKHFEGKLREKDHKIHERDQLIQEANYKAVCLELTTLNTKYKRQLEF